MSVDTLELARQIDMARTTMRDLFGEEYEATIQPWIEAIEWVQETKGVSALAAVAELLDTSNTPPSGEVVLSLLAAGAEIVCGRGEAR